MEKKIAEIKSVTSSELMAHWLKTVNANILKGETSVEYTNKLDTLAAMLAGALPDIADGDGVDLALADMRGTYVTQKDGKETRREANVWNAAVRKMFSVYSVAESDTRKEASATKAAAAKIKREKAARELLGLPEGAPTTLEVKHLDSRFMPVIEFMELDDANLELALRFVRAVTEGNAGSFKLPKRETLKLAA